MTEIQEQKGQLFVNLFQAMHEDETDYICPIAASDFKITSYFNGEQNILQIIMPKPIGHLYCRSVYLCHDKDTKNKSYFTVKQTSTGEYYICGWLDNGAHIIYEEAPHSINNELNHIKSHFTSGFHIEDVIAITVPPTTS